MVNTLYGGTKTEMERLIADANEYAAANGKAADLSIKSFSDIVTAIELIQEKQGIAGTTAKEAATTIEGAFNSTKSAWENLVAGFANPNADIGNLIDELVVSLVGDGNGTGLLAQLIPAIERALDGIGKFISQAAPIISAYFPGLIQKILPPLISAATSLVAGLVRALPMIIQLLIQQAPKIISQLVQAFMDIAPMLIELGKNLMKSIYDGLTQAFPQIKPVLEGLKKTFETAFKAIGSVVDFFKKNFETIKLVVVAVAGAIAGIGLVGIIGGIAGAIGTVVGAIGGLISALSMIKSFAGLVSVITTLAGGPLVLIPALIGAIVAAVIYLWNTSEGFRTFVMGLWETIQGIVAGAIEVLTNLGAAFAAIWQDVVNSATAAWNTIKSVVSTAVTAVSNVVTSIFNAIKTFISNAWNAVQTTTSTVWNAIKTVISTVLNAIKTTVSNVWNAIKSAISSVLSAISSVVSSVFNSIKSFVSSVSDSIKEKISSAWNSAKEKVSSIVGNIKESISSGFNAAKENVSSISDGIKEKISSSFTSAKEKVSSVVNGIKDKISSGFSAAKEKVTSIFDSIREKIKGAMDRAKEAVSNAVEKIKSKMHFSWSLPHLKMPHISISGHFSLNPPSAPHFGISWYKKAYDTPWLFSTPTVIPAMGFGDGNGSEMVYGRDNLMRDIREAQNSGRTEELLTQILARLNEIDPVITLDGRRVSASVDRRLGATVQLKQRGVI